MPVRARTSGVFPKPAELAISSLVFAAVAAALTGLIFLLHWNDSAVVGAHSRLAPSDWVVGVVWIILFATIGSCYQIAKSCCGNESKRLSDWILLLFLVCVAYPFYTAGLSSQRVGLWGNVVTLFLAVYVQWRLLSSSRAASILLLPLSLWLCFACFVLS